MHLNYAPGIAKDPTIIKVWLYIDAQLVQYISNLCFDPVHSCTVGTEGNGNSGRIAFARCCANPALDGGCKSVAAASVLYTLARCIPKFSVVP